MSSSPSRSSGDCYGSGEPRLAVLGHELAEPRRPPGRAQLTGQRRALCLLRRGGLGHRRRAVRALDLALLGLGSRDVVRALPLEDVEPALVVERVQDVVLARPLRRRRRAAQREEVALLGDLPVGLDLQEAYAVLVLRERDEAAVLERRVLLEPVDRAAERAGDRLAVRVDAVAGRHDLGERALELLRLPLEHVLGAVGRELAVVELAAAAEVLLAADEHELVLALARPARRVHELRGVAGVEDLRVRGRAAVLGVDRDRREGLAGGQQDAGADLADEMAGLLRVALLSE